MQLVEYRHRQEQDHKIGEDIERCNDCSPKDGVGAVVGLCGVPIRGYRHTSEERGEGLRQAVTDDEDADC